MAKKKSSYYSKKPLWQWILIYIVIGGIVYALIYYFVIAKTGSSLYTVPTSTAPSYNLPGY